MRGGGQGEGEGERMGMGSVEGVRTEIRVGREQETGAGWTSGRSGGRPESETGRGGGR